MTETMMIIIVAGAVIMAFGLLCLVFIFRSQKETEGFAKRMGAVEKDLGDISKLVSQNAADAQKADENILLMLKKQEEMCAEREAARKAREEAERAKAPAPKPAPPEKPKTAPKPEPTAAPAAKAPPAAPAPAATSSFAPPAQAAPKPAPAPVAPPAPKPAIVTPAVEEDPDFDLNFDEIDINDLLDDLEDVLPELRTNIEPAVEMKKPEITAPPIQHIDYDIGKSGKKYTASELDTLIRE